MSKLNLVETKVFNGKFWDVTDFYGFRVGRIFQVGDGFNARHYSHEEGVFVSSVEVGLAHIEDCEQRQSAVFADRVSAVA